MGSGNFIPKECEIKTDGNLKCDEKDINVEVNGEKPTKGLIVMKNGKIEDETFLIYDLENIIIKNSGKLEFVPTPKSFEEDSWETIAINVKIGNLSVYNVGDTKEIALAGFTNQEAGSNGLYTIRIANTSTPEECNIEGFSQTACGFVIEFVDLLWGQINSDYSNTGGWEASKMRTYVNETIYNALPEELKEKVIDTYAVSGHHTNVWGGGPNYTTTDKLYLLSTKEVWGKEDTLNPINHDTAEAETRQLDYYKSIGVTTNNYSGAIKRSNGNACQWWLRSVDSNYASSLFFNVYSNGSWDKFDPRQTLGVAPAFRI